MFEAYSVAVRVSLINGVTSGLMNISRAFAKTHGNAVALQRQLDQIKFKLLAGAALTGTGLFGLSLIEKTVPAAREYAHQIQQMNVAGMKQVEIAKAVASAWGIAGQVPTATATQNLKAIRELRMVFGNSGAAIANVATVQKLQAILQNATDGHGGNYGDQAYTVAKALEMKGAVRTPGEFNTQADLMAKAIVAAGGKLAPQDFLSTFKYGRSATIGWNDHFAYEILPTLIQEMKSSSGSGGVGGPGNALMSVYDKVINGRIAQKDLPLWASLGLLDPSKVVRTKTGATKGVLPGAVAGWQMFQADPFTWTQKVLMPALAARGVTDPGQQQMMLARLGGTRTAAFMLQQMGIQGWKFDRDVPLIRGARGLAAYNQLVKSDPLMAQQALQAQWTNVKTRLGLAVLPMLIVGTVKLTAALIKLSNWMAAHPALTKGLVLGFAALSAAMAFGGMVLLLSAAFSGIGLALRVVGPGIGFLVRGLFTMGPIVLRVAFAFIRFLGPIGLAVTAVVAVSVAVLEMVKHWDASKSVLWNIRNEFGMFFNWLLNKARGLVGLAPIAYTPEAGGGAPRHIATGGGGATHVTVPVYVDGKKIAEATAKVMNRDLGYGGGSWRFDPTAALPATALGYNR